ncbi:DUF3826 domain-containing protein [Polluticaenibacter yanchengensis]|uniref:DUF3826 domain-containing protein n=1 Tax=Polluticaenibacter yanchengensis TaxID=3014562 RepID=A0ABT4UPS0_9BACT|nr:DUF3826 domain-containing protein [Chitinophagaceae bacterium LY-5]
MKRLLLLSVIVSFISSDVTAQIDSAAIKYQQVVYNRAYKIAADLNISNQTVYNEVSKLIAAHYSNLNDIYNKRDSNLKALKANTGLAKDKAEATKKDIETVTKADIDKIHTQFIAELNKHLTTTQVEGVKNGLTYNVLNVTYKAYNDMIPGLKADEQKQIMEWLIEARELAMDEESSNKKHERFGKYKGRINNYLSQRGYDLQAERKAWEERLKTK